MLVTDNLQITKLAGYAARIKRFDLYWRIPLAPLIFQKNHVTLFVKSKYLQTLSFCKSGHILFCKVSHYSMFCYSRLLLSSLYFNVSENHMIDTLNRGLW